MRLRLESLASEGPAQQRLHLTGLSCAEIEVAALVSVVSGGKLYGRPARQVSQIVGPPIGKEIVSGQVEVL